MLSLPPADILHQCQRSGAGPRSRRPERRRLDIHSEDLVDLLLVIRIFVVYDLVVDRRSLRFALPLAINFETNVFEPLLFQSGFSSRVIRLPQAFPRGVGLDKSKVGDLYVHLGAMSGRLPVHIGSRAEAGMNRRSGTGIYRVNCWIPENDR